MDLILGESICSRSSTVRKLCCVCCASDGAMAGNCLSLYTRTFINRDESTCRRLQSIERNVHTLDEVVISVNYEKHDASYQTWTLLLVLNPNHSRNHVIDVKSSPFLVSWMIPRPKRVKEKK
jgi:hypothetical protein